MNEENTTTLESSPAIEQALAQNYVIATRVFLIASDKSGVWMNRRLEEVELCSGRWQAPGGKVEKGENPLTGIVRELREEAGIELEITSFEPFDVTVYTKSCGKVIQTYYFVARLPEGVTPVNMEPDKAGDFVLVNWDQLESLKVIRGMEECLAQLRVKFDAPGAILAFARQCGRQMAEIKRYERSRKGQKKFRPKLGVHYVPIPGTNRVAWRRKNPFRGIVGWNIAKAAFGTHLMPRVHVPEEMLPESMRRKPTPVDPSSEAVALN